MLFRSGMTDSWNDCHLVFLKYLIRRSLIWDGLSGYGIPLVDTDKTTTVAI